MQTIISTRYQISRSRSPSRRSVSNSIGWIRPMTMETRCSKVIFPNYSKKKPAEDTIVPPLWGTRGKNVCFSRIICSCRCTRRNLRFHVENCQHADHKQLTRRQAFDLDIEATLGQPGSCRARPCLLYTSPSPRDGLLPRMPSSA